MTDVSRLTSEAQSEVRARTRKSDEAVVHTKWPPGTETGLARS